MIGRIFYWILNMAVVGSLTGLIVLVVRRSKRLPRNFIYALYSIVFLRFVCPFGIVNGLSFLNLLPKGTILMVDPSTGSVDSKDISMSFMNSIQTAESYGPLQQKSDGWTLAYKIGGSVWIIIAIVILLGYFIMYIRARKELKYSGLVHGEIYHSDAVDSPMTVGIRKPMIILPMGLGEENTAYRYVIAHERTHIRKKDNLWRMFAILITSVYWFNPLVWILQKAFFTDMELACDESTIRAFDSTDRKRYAQALLSMSVAKPVVYAAGFTGSGVKVRIKRVISYKQITLLSGICLVGLFILCAVCLLSNQ